MRLPSCAMFTLCAGCLVLEPIDFEAEQLPAHLSSPKPVAFTRKPPPEYFDPTCKEVNDVGVMAFSVDINDANVTEVLQARLIINNDFKDYVEVRPTGSEDRGTTTLCAVESDLNKPCNRVEILVSSSFTGPGDDRSTFYPNDLATAEWWVLARVEDSPIAGQDECSKLVEP